jgi:tetratricopeptide (TPR) repeat protein
MLGMKKILIIIFLINSQVSFAQGLKVDDVKETVSGSDAFHAPIDENGHPCGLVKVLAVFPDLRFDGNVVGDVTPENNEYKVYLAKGSKQLVIKRSGVLPVIVDFPTCGIPEISSKATYTVKLKEVSLNSQKNSIIIDTKPRNAKVYIDDILIDNEHGDGGYQLLLPKGEHLCKVEAKGYRSYASVVKTGKGLQTINAELESLLADIDISCQTSGAHLFVDGEEVGIGSWKGKLPAGSYKVEASLEGYLPITQSIELSEKDNQVLNLPSLKRAKGNISVQTNIKDADVYLDGNRVNNPKHIPDVQTGNHVLKIKAPFGYKEVEKDITISSGDNNTIRIDMEPIDEIYAKAFSGKVDAQAELCKKRYESSKYQDADSIERNYWYEHILDNIDKIDKKTLEKVWYYDGPSQRQINGIYEYFENDHIKSVKLLHRVIQLGYEEYENLAYHYYKLGKYEEAILYGTKAINYPEYDYYFNSQISDACFKLKDVSKGIAIILGAIEATWDDPAKGVAYEGIGDIYFKIHNNSQAGQFYKKSLQLWQKLKSQNYDWVDDEIKKVNSKIRQCGY